VRFPEFVPHSDTALSVCLPEIYADSLKQKRRSLEEIRAQLKNLPDESSAQKVNAILSGHFREWLSINNKVKPIIDVAKSRDNHRK
jgi:hypothetical protein